MIDLMTIVYFVFGAIIVVAILALLWFAIGYAQKSFPSAPPMAWTIVRLIFVLLCVFFLICFLLGLLGHPIIRI